jgi:hypothetical protein
VLKAIAARLGFDLVSHRLELFGRRTKARAAGKGSKPAAEQPREGARAAQRGLPR